MVGQHQSQGRSLSVPAPVPVSVKVGLANRTHVAKGVGVTRQHVIAILAGKKEPGLGVAKRMADELGVSLEQFWEYWSGLREAA